jgi:glycosyltransferase involved in cell wall biosynthesis
MSKFFGRLVLLTERLLWQFIDRLIVVSPSIKSWYMNNVGEKESDVILNSPVIEQDLTSDYDNYFRNFFSIPSHSKVFIYIGILGKGRGIDLITEVFKTKGVQSSVVFLGYGELKGELEKLSLKHDNIYVHDTVPHEKVVPLSQSADIGLCLIQNVSLSDYYCLPNKLFEYCFSGIPVLASDLPDITDVVNQYDLGITCSLNVESVLMAVKEFEELKELPKINLENLNDLTWGAQEEKLLKLYKKILQSKKK